MKKLFIWLIVGKRVTNIQACSGAGAASSSVCGVYGCVATIAKTHARSVSSACQKHDGLRERSQQN
jgi:hypothetical protein